MRHISGQRQNTLMVAPTPKWGLFVVAALTNTFSPPGQPHGMISDTSVLLKDTNLEVLKEGYM